MGTPASWPAGAASNRSHTLRVGPDGVVYVTKFNKIRREHGRKSIQRIQNAGIHILGVVINDIDFEGKDSYYYSYYYYQNRYYSSHYKTTPGSGKDAKVRKSDEVAKV